MKTKTIFKSMMMAVCCLGIATLASCKDDKDDNKGLKFSVAKVEVAQGASAKVTIGNGTQPYTAKSTNEKLATVKVDKNMMTVTGVAVGKASVVVTDKNKKTGTLSVNVFAPVSFDKQTITVPAGKEGVVAIKSGKAPFTVNVKDKNIATAMEKDGKITVKGVKAGTTTITVMDKDKASGIFTVTVK